MQNSTIAVAWQHDGSPISYAFRSVSIDKRTERASSASNISDVSDSPLSEMSENQAQRCPHQTPAAAMPVVPGSTITPPNNEPRINFHSEAPHD